MDSKKGSKIAKDGFKNEYDVVNKFKNWKHDFEAKEWLKIMGYNLEHIESVDAKVLSGYKTDVSVEIKVGNCIEIQNIQVKLVSTSRGYNQVDKRWVDNYTKLWNIPEDIQKLLKYFTGEFKPYKESRNVKRMFIDEFDYDDQIKFLNFFKNNKSLILNDILRSSGEFAANWMIVAQKTKNNQKWVLKSMEDVINHYNGSVKITPRGSLKIGNVTMQRKGGDGGKSTANMLQFKVDPTQLFD